MRIHLELSVLAGFAICYTAADFDGLQRGRRGAAWRMQLLTPKSLH
jgi:hypothetical protein